MLSCIPRADAVFVKGINPEMIYERDFLRELARKREELHRNHASSRPLSPGYEYVGVIGEAEVSYSFGGTDKLPMDVTLRPGGDRHIDFVFPYGHTADVKTARIPTNLFLEVGKPNPANILILARYNDRVEQAILIGWEWSKRLLECPTKDFGKGVINHYLEATKLRGIEGIWEFFPESWKTGLKW